MGPKAAVTVAPLRRSLLSSSSSRGSRAVALRAMVQPVVVVGGGRVGQALLSMGPPTSGDLLLRRGEALQPGAPAGPILVCTRNDDLDGVLDATPRSRWQGAFFHHQPTLPPSKLLLRAKLMMERAADLVLFQNGMLDPWLESKGLTGASQVLAYFAVSKVGGRAPRRRHHRRQPRGAHRRVRRLGPRRRRAPPERRPHLQGDFVTRIDSVIVQFVSVENASHFLDRCTRIYTWAADLFYCVCLLRGQMVHQQDKIDKSRSSFLWAGEWG